VELCSRDENRSIVNKKSVTQAKMEDKIGGNENTSQH
jgi:hypothetical protein